MDNLLADLPQEAQEEIVDVLVNARNCRIERIVSTGQSSPDGFWYDQVESEWVLVLAGSGGIEFNDGTELNLGAGDFVNIPARKKHRVKWTASNEPTVWLAIFYSADT